MCTGVTFEEVRHRNVLADVVVRDGPRTSEAATSMYSVATYSNPAVMASHNRLWPLPVVKQVTVHLANALRRCIVNSGPLCIVTNADLAPNAASTVRVEASDCFCIRRPAWTFTG